MGKPLRPELIMQRSKSDRLDMVKNLNLWGNDIDDVTVLRELPNVEVLSLSVNKITTLNDFKYCAKLSELYLRKNLITDLQEVQHLRGLKNLRVLWLWDNPCSEQSNYRAYIIHLLPQLTKLDNQNVTAEEKSAAGSSDLGLPPPEKHRAPPVERSPPQDRQDLPERREIKTRDPPARDYAREEHGIGRQSPAREAPQRPVTSENRRLPQRDSKNENILCAILALLKELDDSGLELVKREVERKLRG